MRLNRFFLVAIVGLFFATSYSSVAQQWTWGVGMDYFFDNTEFEYSSYVRPHTMGGAWVHATGGVQWGDYHALETGVHLLKMHGVNSFVDKALLSAYYQLKTDRVRLRLGAMPLQEVTGRYSDFFIRDSVYYYDPMMLGMAFEMTDGERWHGLVWLDWTGHATAERRESFQAGVEMRAFWHPFYASLQSRIFHLAGHNPRDYDVSVVEHGMVQVDVGLRRNLRWKEAVLDGSIGLLAALERDRIIERQYTPLGLVLTLGGEVAGVGVRNKLYAGQRHFRMYETYEKNLYWGNPFLRGSSYLQSHWFAHLIKTEGVRLDLDLKFHFSEGRMFHQEALTLRVALSPEQFRKDRKLSLRDTCPWLGLFE